LLIDGLDVVFTPRSINKELTMPKYRVQCFKDGMWDGNERHIEAADELAAAMKVCGEAPLIEGRGKAGDLHAQVDTVPPQPRPKMFYRKPM
jgi:hypothetical protein